MQAQLSDAEGLGKVTLWLDSHTLTRVCGRFGALRALCAHPPPGLRRCTLIGSLLPRLHTPGQLPSCQMANKRRNYGMALVGIAKLAAQSQLLEAKRSVEY